MWKNLAETTVRDTVLAFMRDFKINTIFGNPGSTELPMFRDFPADFRYVLGLQEAAVVGMADGFAQATKNAAFVNLHSAAGVGNAMGNIYTAYKNQTPLVIIAGQQSRGILPFDPYLHSAQATELPKPYVKYSIEPARAQDVPLAIARAYYTAMQAPRGPVLVSVPADDWDRHAAPVAVRVVSTEARPQPDILEVIGRHLDACQRPALVLGASVDRDEAWDEVIRLAELHSAGVYVAPNSARCAFPEDHPQFMGFLPAYRERIVAQLAQYDLIFVIGAPAFTYHVDGEGPYVPEGATLCQLTDDPAAAAWAPVGVAAVGNIRLGLGDLLARPLSAKRPRPPARPAVARVEPSDPLTVAYALQTLADLRNPADIIVEEAPSSRIVMHPHLPILQRETFYTMASGGLGFGMPAAVGIALARPDEKVICVIGDGSSMYSIQALWTAAQFNLNITFLVLNNRSYAALKRFASVFNFPTGAAVAGTDLPGLDFVALANGHGCSGVRVTNAEGLHEALARALRTSGPALIEAIVA